MGRPKAQRPHVKRPSPLQQVHHTRVLSTGDAPNSLAPPATSLVRDPQFWKRFSVAVHQAEDDEEMGGKDSGSSRRGTVNSRNQWLDDQRQQKRNARRICAIVTLFMLLLVAAIAGLIYYLRTRT